MAIRTCSNLFRLEIHLMNQLLENRAAYVSKYSDCPYEVLYRIRESYPI